MGLSLSVPLILCGVLDAEALLKNPTSKQVQEALKRGADFAEQRRPPNELYWHFGSTEKFEPYGFMVTKVSGLAVMSCHYALRGERPTDQDIQRILEEDMLQVVVIIFGDSSSFARESYLLFQQNGQMVKPTRIRFDARAQAMGQHHGVMVYRAKIVGLFSYDAFDSEAQSTLLVFPGRGGEIRFDLDLLAIP